MFLHLSDVHTYLDGGGSGTIWLSGLLCFGSESLLQSCPAIYTLGQPPPSCTHGQDVGVSCQPNIFEGSCCTSVHYTSIDTSNHVHKHIMYQGVGRIFQGS